MDNVEKPAVPLGPPPALQPRQRKRLEPSEKQLKQQTSHHNPPQRQRSFQQTQTIMAGLYDLEETLGKGHFATVKAAKHVFTGERVAVKVIDKTKLDTISQKALLKEVLCMKLVQHPNVVKLYEVIDTSSKMFLVLELGQGDLYDLILRQQGGLPESQARVYFKQIVKAVSYCHKLHVAHRDLKPENVVFFPHNNSQKESRKPPPTKKQQSTLLLGQLKLTDFGFSNKFCPGVKLETSCGSLAYSAPEILLGDSYDAPAVDIWSLGVILYMLVAGRAPFQEANDSETLTMIMDVKYTLPDCLTKDLKDLIRRMLVRDPRRRARLSEIETHEWITAKGEYDDDDNDEGPDDVECYYHSGGNEEQQQQKEHQQQQRCVVNKALPLIASNTLSEGERERIIGEMVKGGVVSAVEEVKGSLNSNAYNHITSTYYLLAERYLREKALRHHHNRRLSSSTSTTSSKPDHHQKPSLLLPDHGPPTTTTTTTTTPDESPSSSSTTPQQQSPQKQIRIRKNSHQFEDITLPSTSSSSSSPTTNPSPKQQSKKKHETQTIESLDLETTSSRTVVHHHAAPPPPSSSSSSSSSHHYQGNKFSEEDELSVLESNNKKQNESRNNSPHHPHYYHHLGKRVSSPTQPQQQQESQSQQSPPKHCNDKQRQRMRPHHSHSDSSDEGGGGGGSTVAGTTPNNPPSINIVVSEEEPTQQQQQQQQKQQQENSSSNNNVLSLLKPSPSYEGIVEEVNDEEDEDDELKKRSKTKKKRILFLSWFFSKKSSSGSKSSKVRSSGANGIYKTRSCAELKMRGVSDQLSTRDCFGVNGLAGSKQQ